MNGLRSIVAATDLSAAARRADEVVARYVEVRQHHELPLARPAARRGDVTRHGRNDNGEAAGARRLEAELMAKRYTHFAPEQLRTAANKLGTLLGTPGSAEDAETRTTSSMIWLSDPGFEPGTAA